MGVHVKFAPRDHHAMWTLTNESDRLLCVGIVPIRAHLGYGNHLPLSASESIAKPAAGRPCRTWASMYVLPAHVGHLRLARTVGSAGRAFCQRWVPAQAPNVRVWRLHRRFQQEMAATRGLWTPAQVRSRRLRRRSRAPGRRLPSQIRAPVQA